MAQKKTGTAAKQRSSGSKPAATTATKARSQTARSAEKKMTVEAIRQRNQVRAVVLFALAIFLGCLVLIPGDNLWKWAHNAILGLFGGWSILWPLLMIYIAVITTLDRPMASISGKVWLTVLVIILFCASGYVFQGKYAPEGLKAGEFLHYLYQDNSGLGGGVFGGLLGVPLVKAVGETGARIILLLLLFVALMILTGTTLIGLFRAVKRPVTKVSEGVQTMRQRREEEREILERERANIDIPLAPQLPSHPVRSDPTGLFPPPEPRKKRENTEKLDKLKEVFGLESQEPQPIAPAVSDAEKALENAVQELPDDLFVGQAEHPAPAQPPEAEPPAPPPMLEEPAAVEQARRPEEPAVSEEVKQLTESFLEEKAENDRRETMAVAPAEGPPQPAYIYPPVTMLAASPHGNPAQETEELQTNGQLLVDTLKSFGVQTKILDICRGPSVTRYEIQPAAGVKISKITNLSDDLALNLAATGVRIEAPIPGKAAVGIEIPNKSRSTVRMRELIESNSFQTSKGKLSVALGRDIAGQPVVADLAKMPHLLIAGTTGSGKSVCINSLIISMLYKASPDEVRFLMIDPKAVELTEYNGMPHMLVPVVTDPKKAAGALSWAVSEMMNRYKIFADCNVRNLAGYNSLAESSGFQDENGQPMPPMPQIVIIIDELADLMMASPKDVEDSICRLAQLARAAGMHLVVATQRPSVDVVTGLIKANIPSRIALTVSNGVDSRTILDTVGAEKLLGNGDMLFAPVGATKPIRVQGCYVSDEEISSIVEFVKRSKALDYDETVIEEIERHAAEEKDKGDASESENSEVDPLMDDAVKVVVEAGQASASLVQRRLRLGYVRAGRIIDQMEELGIVGPHEGSKPRQVLMTYSQWQERHMMKSTPAPVPVLPDGDEE